MRTECKSLKAFGVVCQPMHTIRFIFRHIFFSTIDTKNFFVFKCHLANPRTPGLARGTSVVLAWLRIRMGCSELCIRCPNCARSGCCADLAYSVPYLLFERFHPCLGLEDFCMIEDVVSKTEAIAMGPELALGDQSRLAAGVATFRKLHLARGKSNCQSLLARAASALKWGRGDAKLPPL